MFWSRRPLAPHTRVVGVTDAKSRVRAIAELVRSRMGSAMAPKTLEALADDISSRVNSTTTDEEIEIALAVELTMAQRDGDLG